MSRTHRRRTTQRKGAVRLGLLLVALVAVNVYVLFLGSGSLRRVSEAATRARAELAPPPPRAAAPGRSLDGRLRAGEGVAAALRREGVAAVEADAVIRALSPRMSFTRELAPGQRYRLLLDENGRILTFELEARSLYAVRRTADGALEATSAPLPERPKPRR